VCGTVLNVVFIKKLCRFYKTLISKKWGKLTVYSSGHCNGCVKFELYYNKFIYIAISKMVE